MDKDFDFSYLNFMYLDWSILLHLQANCLKMK